MSFNIAVQTAIYSALVDAVSVPVYDDVPQSSGWDGAYITIGEDVISYSDTDSEEMKTCSITVHTWSRARGRKELKELQDQVYFALNNANLVHSGYNFVIITEENAESILDADGKTRHGIQTFNLIIEKIED